MISLMISLYHYNDIIRSYNDIIGSYNDIIRSYNDIIRSYNDRSYSKKVIITLTTILKRHIDPVKRLRIF